MAKLQDKVRKLEAQERRTERAKDTRRKVLLGALVMDELERDTVMSGELRRWLANRIPDYLTRDHDRDVMARFMGGDGTGDIDVGSAGDLTNDGGEDEAPSAPSPVLGRHGDDHGR